MLIINDCICVYLYYIKFVDYCSFINNQGSWSEFVAVIVNKFLQSYAVTAFQI